MFQVLPCGKQRVGRELVPSLREGGREGGREERKVREEGGREGGQGCNVPRRGRRLGPRSWGGRSPLLPGRREGGREEEGEVRSRNERDGTPKCQMYRSIPPSFPPFLHSSLSPSLPPVLPTGCNFSSPSHTTSQASPNTLSLSSSYKKVNKCVLGAEGGMPSSSSTSRSAFSAYVSPAWKGGREGGRNGGRERVRGDKGGDQAMQTDTPEA